MRLVSLIVRSGNLLARSDVIRTQQMFGIYGPRARSGTWTVYIWPPKSLSEKKTTLKEVDENLHFIHET